jgi:hypothetical protein
LAESLKPFEKPSAIARIMMKTNAISGVSGML